MNDWISLAVVIVIVAAAYWLGYTHGYSNRRFDQFVDWLKKH